MRTGKKIKKVNYSIMSDEVCLECGRPLKQNSADKGHKWCFVCFKIRQGKGTDELLEKQKKNKQTYLEEEVK